MHFNRKKNTGYAVSLAFAALFFFTGHSAKAAPAAPIITAYTQPDGAVFQAEKQGDDIFNWTAAQDGAVIVQNKDGYWYYAEIRNNRLAAGPVKYAAQPRPAHVLSADDMAPLHLYFSRLREASTLEEDRPSKSAAYANGELRTTQSLSKPHPMLVLLVNFNNVSMSTAESQWRQLVFGDSGKTVNQYYKENSAQRFYFTPAQETAGTPNDGIVTVTLNQNHPNTGGNPNQLNRQLVADALKAADSQIDYSSYDTNHNGYISADELHIVTIIAGQEASYRDSSYNASLPSVWGHHWAMPDSSSPTVDGVKLLSAAGGGSYTQFGELQGRHQATIGIIVHELGHDLDLPDLYDVDPNNSGDTNGVGGFSVMGAGNWSAIPGEYAGTTPVHLDAWSKIFLGFASPVEVPYGTDVSATLKAFDTTNPGAYQIYKVKTGNPDEYFLLENRQQGARSGFDQGLRDYTAQSGIAIWHIDSNVIRNHFNAVNDVNPKGVDLESFDISPDDPFYHDGDIFDRYHPPGSTSHNGTETGISVVVPASSSYSMPFLAGKGPAIAAAPKLASTADSFTYASQWDEAATLYYEAVPSGSKAPSVVQIMRGQDSAGRTAAFAGRFSVTGGKPGTIALSGLTASTSYDFYVLGVDANGHLGMSDIQSFTTSPPALPPSTPVPAVIPPTAAVPAVPAVPVVPAIPSTGGNAAVPVVPAVPPTGGSTVVPPAGPQVKSAGDREVIFEQLTPEAVNGANVWKIDAGLLGQAFEALQSRQASAGKIRIPVSLSDGQPAIVELAADALVKGARADANAVISVTSDSASYELPVRAIDLAAIAQKLGVSLKDAVVQVQIAQVGGRLLDEMEGHGSYAGLHFVGAPVEYTVTVAGNGKTEELRDFGRTYVSRTLVLEQAVNPSSATVVMYDPDTGRFSFVPATFSVSGGKTVVTLQRTGNSIYTVALAQKSFADIRTHWARDDIELLASKSLLKGLSNTSFGPNQAVTRAQFAAMLVQALGLRETSAAASFKDVKASDWYAGYVGAAVQAGLVQGFSDGRFRPNDRITREQMAAMINNAARFAGQPLADQADRSRLGVFKDRSSISAYALDSVSNVVQAGIMTGMKPNEFRAADFATRGQSASILKRLLVHLQFIN
ncbi:M6 family metalloprotease domain-containing protein [Cohnella pontilimi]|uniref:M6 family metalloprotease domain-containing protein n=1 Tax=Cohnella pontilimi TaxID=2564100 RepID=UPI00145DBAE8|nr:M6 family metalloprotease domain-containing protein [Cohnella pontilimi]